MADNSTLIESLFKAGAHFGYSRSRRHPSTLKYLFGAKGGVEIFDLEKTAELVEKAKTFVRGIAADRGVVLFVGGKAEAREAVIRTAESLNLPFSAGRFIGGSLTNWSEIKKRVERLVDLSDKREKGELAKYTKLERLLIDREIDDLTTMFGGLRGMTKLPSAMVVIDPRREKIAVTEARKMKIPVIALLNSDCDATEVNYPVAANDATLASVQLFLSEIKSAWEEGLKAAPAPKEEPAAVTQPEGAIA